RPLRTAPRPAPPPSRRRCVGSAGFYASCVPWHGDPEARLRITEIRGTAAGILVILRAGSGLLTVRLDEGEPMGKSKKRRVAGAVLCVALAVTAGAFAAKAQSGQPHQTQAASVPASPGVAQASLTPSLAPTLGLSPSLVATPSPSKPRTPSPKPTSSDAAAHGVPAGWRTLTMVNRLDETIWPAIAADPKHPISATGWVLAPGASLTILIPDHWDVRLWARTGCSFNAAGVGSCVTSGCGKLQCGSTWGEFPSTLAEFNLNAWNGMD